ncbi:MAG: iron-sulfur cluster assembly scaffold protein [Acidobacteriaceae bacterium]
MPFPPQVIEHFEHPRCAGELPNANTRVRVENPVCGDILELAARIEGGTITEVRFKAKGCVAAMAAASALCEQINGAPIAAAQALTRKQIIDALGGLTPESMHVSHLAIDAIHALLKSADL